MPPVSDCGKAFAMATPDRILDLFERMDGDYLTTAEVASELHISKKAAWVHLSNLHKDGLLEKDPGDELHAATWSPNEASAAESDES